MTLHRKYVRHSKLKPDEYEPDPIYFLKTQVKVGTVLTHFGRLDPNSRWTVKKILTVHPDRNKYKSEWVSVAKKWSDTVTLVREGTSEKEARQATVGYLMTSALWRTL